MTRARNLANLGNKNAITADIGLFNIGIGSTQPTNYKLDVVGGNAYIGGGVTITGNLSVGGTVTYEDVTNVDAVGIVTARSGVRIVGGGLTCVGVSTFAGNVNISGLSTTKDLLVTGVTTIGNGSNSYPLDVVVHSTNAKLQVRDGNTSGNVKLNAVNFAGSSNTNLEIATTDTIFFGGGTQRMKIDSAGKVKIGTGSAQHQLQIELAAVTNSLSNTNTYIGVGGDENAVDAYNLIGIGYVNGTTQYPVQIGAFTENIGGHTKAAFIVGTRDVTTDTAPTERLRVAASGYVGIGTTTPDRTLSVHKDATARFNIKSLANSTAGIEFGDTADHNAGYIVYDNTNNSFQVGLNGTGQKIHVTSDGDVFVGSTSNNGKFAIVGSSAQTSATHADTQGASLILSNTDTTNNNWQGVLFSDRTDGDDFVTGVLSQCTDHTNNYGELAFYTNGSSGRYERLRIDADGVVTIAQDYVNSQSAWGVASRLQLHGTNWNPTSISLHNWGNNTTASSLLFMKSKGGSVGNYDTVPADGESLGYIAWSPADTADATNLCATIRCVVDGTISENDTPGALTFSTTADGGTTHYERMRIAANGNVAIGGTVTPQASSSAYNGSTLHLYQQAGSGYGSEIKWSHGLSGHTASDGAYMAFYSDNNMYCNIRETGNWLFYTSNAERFAVDSAGGLRTALGSQLSHKSGGDKLVYTDAMQKDVDDSTSGYHVMKTWTADKSGSFDLEVTMKINSGAYYFAYIIYNATQSARVNAAGTGNDSSNCRWTDHLATGQTSSVHAMRRFRVTCGATDSSVRAGDTLQLQMASCAATGALVTGTGQALKARGLRIYSTTGNTGTGAVDGSGYNAATNTRNCCYWWLDRNGNEANFNASTTTNPIAFNRLVEYQNFTDADWDSGVVTVTISGVYQLSASAYSDTGGAAFSQSWFVVDGSRHTGCDVVHNQVGHFACNNQVMYLDAGQTIGFHPYDAGTTLTITDNAYHTYFKGCLINATTAGDDY